MKTAEIRRKFTEYFTDHGHREMPSSGLVPLNDPTLLFTNAGMVQFKDVFTGKANLNTKRVVTVQKCVRAGGKHNDLENVGHTARHHTFFEMLGNFSFGDYFKKEAIQFAWEFLTKTMQLDASRLHATVFREDEEAERIWLTDIGLPKNRVTRKDEKDNFWAMGDTGPCGPCSEIIYDQGKEIGCKRPACDIHCECDRHLEIWNLVFMQFNRDSKDAPFKPLPNPSIDTGMGLERLTAIKQGVTSNFEIDIIRAILDHTAKRAGIRYGASSDGDVSLRVIADHARAATFLISDGVLPGNEGAAYVLRRIMRRAVRHGNKLGFEQPFLFETAGVVIETMKDAYPAIDANRELIQQAIKREEQQFAETLDRGLDILDQEMRRLKAGKDNTLSGELIFKLYDTYGFPVDLTQTIADENKIAMDLPGFEREMTRQRERSQSAGKSLGKTSGAAVLDGGNVGKTRFLGYENLSGKSKLLRVATDENGENTLITEQTPFYAESGGQMGDTGVIRGDSGFEFDVTDTRKTADGVFVHLGKLRRGKPVAGEPVSLEVEAARRKLLVLNHSATHLVHAALRTILGKHVHQKGSLVAPNRLRFDFTHFEATPESALLEIEDLCNEHVRLNHPVVTRVLPYQEAIKTGAMALFGEKYGDQVRVVSMSDFSIELCGGTHVQATGEIGLIKINTESGVSSGVRRVEAWTGKTAIASIREYEKQIAAIAAKIKSANNPKELEQKIDKLLQHQKKLEEDLRKWQQQPKGGGDASSRIKNIGGTQVMTHQVDDLDPKDLRTLGDQMRDQIKSGVVALASVREGKASLLVLVTKDLTGRFKAGELIRGMAKHVGGTGGGRPDMAQAGGPTVDGIAGAFAELESAIAGS